MRVLILAHDHFDPEHAKTATGVIRYSHHEVVGVVDRSKAGQDAGRILGPAGLGIPIVRSVEEALHLEPEALLVGIAPVGGGLPPEWRSDLRAALEHGLDVISGLHTYVGDDEELAALARDRGATIQDVRKPPAARRIATGEGMRVDAVVVLTVGTDCSSGKMTTTVELARAAQERGINAGWVATGQTGLMISASSTDEANARDESRGHGADAGAPVDATVSDFVAGTVERCVMDAAERRDLVFVEGQGAITHPAYSAVTAGILHGAFPDLLVLCDVTGRERFHFPSVVDFPKNSLEVEKRLNEDLLRGTTGGRVAAASLVTRGLDDDGAAEAIAAAEKALGVPAGDLFRGHQEKLLDALLDALAKGWSKKAAAKRVLHQAETEA